MNSILCHARGVLLCVDGIQGVGALALDVGQVPLDFLAVGGPKWLMGPIGTGFLFIRRQHIPTLDLGPVGWEPLTPMSSFGTTFPGATTPVALKKDH